MIYKAAKLKMRTKQNPNNIYMYMKYNIIIIEKQFVIKWDMVVVSSTKSQMISGWSTQYEQNVKGTDLK